MNPSRCRNALAHWIVEARMMFISRPDGELPKYGKHKLLLLHSVAVWGTVIAGYPYRQYVRTIPSLCS